MDHLFSNGDQKHWISIFLLEGEVLPRCDGELEGSGVWWGGVGVVGGEREPEVLGVGGGYRK